MEALGVRLGVRSLHREPTLVDVLTTATAAAPVLIQHLLKAGALKEARLSCKAARQYIDGNISLLHVKVTESDLHQWVSLKGPSLTRWTNCSSVHIYVEAPPSSNLDQTLADMAALPFMDLGPGARACIRDIELSISPSHYALQNGMELSVRSMVSLVPQLRSLDLQHVSGMSYGYVHQRLMYASLSLLPHLEELVLPCNRALDHIGALANGPAGSSLRRLTTTGSSVKGLSRDAVHSLSRLTRLEMVDVLDPQLHEHDFFATDSAVELSLADLLNGLPPSVEELRLSYTFIYPRCTFRLCGGRLVSLGVYDSPFVPPCQLSGLAAQVLASRVMASDPQQPGPLPAAPALHRPEQQQQRLESFSIETVSVSRDTFPWDLAPAPLRELLRRCGKVSVGKLKIEASQHASVLLGLLGKPATLCWDACMTFSVELTLRRDEEPPELAPPQQARGQAPAAVLPSTEEVAHRLVRRLLGKADGPAVAASSGAAAASPSAGGPPGGATDGVVGAGETGVGGSAAATGTAVVRAGAGLPDLPKEGRDYHPRMFLLRGEFIRVLSKAPHKVASWVDRVRAKRAQAGHQAAGDASLVSYIVLPRTTGAAVIDCGTEAGAAAVAAAVREAGRGKLEVLPVVAELRASDAVMADDLGFAAHVYDHALGEVLQGIWDGRWSSGAVAALGEADILRRLAELMESVEANAHGNLWHMGDWMPFFGSPWD